MKLNQKDILKIQDIARHKFKEFPIQAYWEYSKEVDEQEAVAISWIQAISSVLKLKLEVDFKKERQ